MTGFTLPTSRPITQPWGAEFDDWDGDGTVDYPGGFYHSIGWDGHNGIDYGCFVGDPIEAVADGVVTFAGDAGNWHAILSGGGNAILVEHPAYGVQTEYLHLSRWAVNAGDTVKRGQVIGYSGSTGAATAPHLHLGMLRINGYNLGDRWRGRIDPTPYLYGKLNPDYAGLAPQSTTTRPIKEDTLSAAEVQEIKDHINAVVYGGTTWNGSKKAPLWSVAVVNQNMIKGIPAKVWATTIFRSGKRIPVLQELADIKTKVLGLEPVIAEIQENTSAEDVALSIPDDIAQQVIDALAARLSGVVK